MRRSGSSLIGDTAAWRRLSFLSNYGRAGREIMNSKLFSKSQAFKEREANAREKIRQVVKQDFVADLSRFHLSKILSNFYLVHVKQLRNKCSVVYKVQLYIFPAKSK